MLIVEGWNIEGLVNRGTLQTATKALDADASYSHAIAKLSANTEPH